MDQERSRYWDFKVLLDRLAWRSADSTCTYSQRLVCFKTPAILLYQRDLNTDFYQTDKQVPQSQMSI